MDDERGNIRAVLIWLPERGAVERALQMTGSVWAFWWCRGLLTEGRTLLDRILAHPDATRHTLARTDALGTASLLAASQDDDDVAATRLAESLAIFRELGDDLMFAWQLILTYMYLVKRRAYAEAIANVERGLAVIRSTADTPSIVKVERMLGYRLLMSGDCARARPLLEQCRRLATAHENRLVSARAGHDLATVLLARAPGDPRALAQAETLLLETLSVQRAFDSQYDLPWTLVALGQVRLTQGNLAEAMTLLDEALAVARRTGNRETAALALRALGDLTRQRGDVASAAGLLCDALTVTLAMSSQPGLPNVVSSLAALANALGQPAVAARLAGAVEALPETRHDVVTPRDRLDNEQVSRVARAHLGDVEYRRAHEEGRAMSLEEIVASAEALGSAIPAPVAPATATHGLSARELEVLREMAEGRSNQEIADALSLSTRTVSTHITSILTKLDLPSRTAAVAYAIRAGLA